MKRHRLNDLPSADDALIPKAPFVEPGTSVPPESTSVLENERTEAPMHESTVAPEHQSAEVWERESATVPESHSTEAPEHGRTSLPQHESTMAEEHPSTKAPRRSSTKARKSAGTEAPKHDGASEPGRLHVSTYLTPDVVKRVEEVRFRLRVERGQKKISKADVIERALRIGLEDIDQLASA